MLSGDQLVKELQKGTDYIAALRTMQNSEMKADKHMNSWCEK